MTNINALPNEWLDAIRKRAEAATKSPWKVERNEFSGDNWLIADVGEDYEGVPHYITTDNLRASEANGGTEEDAEFIAHAREDIPMLLAEIERLQGINDLVSNTVTWGVSCSGCSNQLAENWKIIGGAFICAECTVEAEGTK